MLLTIVRHGESRQQIDPAQRWNPDSSLSELGILQAKQTGRRLCESRLTRIVSSPLRRALETAYHIAMACGVEHVEVWEDIREGFLSSFPSSDQESMLGCCPRAHVDNVAWEHGHWINREDTRDAFFDQCERAFRRLFVETEEHGHTAVVTHGAFANWLIHRALEIPPRDDAVVWFELDNCSLSQFEGVRGPLAGWPIWWLYPSIRLKVLALNNTAHLLSPKMSQRC